MGSDGAAPLYTGSDVDFFCNFILADCRILAGHSGSCGGFLRAVQVVLFKRTILGDRGDCNAIGLFKPGRVVAPLTFSYK